MNKPTFTALLALVLLVALSGCATTRIDVTTAEGLRVRASFPKNMDATGLRLAIGPHELTAERLQTDAASVVQAQSALATSALSAAARLP